MCAGAHRQRRRSTGSCRSPRPRQAVQKPVPAVQACSALTETKDFAGGYRSYAACLLEQQAPRVIEPLEAAGKLPLWQPHLQDIAEAGCPFEPVRAGRRKAKTAFPLRQTLLHGPCELLEQSVGHNQRTQASKVGRGIVGLVWMGGAIHADADRDGERRLALALDQNAGNLCLLDKQVVRPLQLQVGPDLWRAGSDR